MPGWLVLFLAVSCVTFTLQCLMVTRLLIRRVYRGTEGRVSGGYIRTVSCRIAAACAYVVLAAVQLGGSVSLAVTFTVFTAVQALWLANSLADVRLRDSFTGEEKASLSRAGREGEGLVRRHR